MNTSSYVVGFFVIVLIASAGYFYFLRGNSSEQEANTYTPPETTASDVTAKEPAKVEVPNTSTSSATIGSTKTLPKTFTVNYTDAGFLPKSIEIKAGDTVKFVNWSSDRMWVASAPHPVHTIYPEFDQKSSGDTYEFTFTRVGSWDYHNHASANKTGTVVVK